MLSTASAMATMRPQAAFVPMPALARVSVSMTDIPRIEMTAAELMDGSGAAADACSINSFDSR